MLTHSFATNNGLSAIHIAAYTGFSNLLVRDLNQNQYFIDYPRSLLSVCVLSLFGSSELAS